MSTRFDGVSVDHDLDLGRECEQIPGLRALHVRGFGSVMNEILVAELWRMRIDDTRKVKKCFGSNFEYPYIIKSFLSHGLY